MNGCGGKNGEWGKWGKDEWILASWRGTKVSLGGVRGRSGGLPWVIRDFSSSFGEDPLLCESGEPEQGLYSSRPIKASSSFVLGLARPGNKWGGNGGARWCGEDGILGGDRD